MIILDHLLFDHCFAGIITYSSLTGLITNSVFTNNNQGMYWGDYGFITLYNCSFDGNTGNSFFTEYATYVNISNCNFSNLGPNAISIYALFGTFLLYNSTFTNCNVPGKTSICGCNAS